MTGDCESERIWKLIESSRSLQTAARKKSSLTLLEHISNACADVSEKLQDKRFTVPVNVLEQLLGGVVTPSVIIDLLPDHEGYTVSLGNRGAGSHAHRRDHHVTLPYEDTELLDYLDAGHIPPVLLELIDRTHCCQLVDGCLVVELRNHRGYHNSSGKFSQHYFLLRPTAQSVIAAVNHAVNAHKVTNDDGLQLESKILLATQPPLCLDTSTDVTCVANRLQYNKHKFHTHCIKRYLKRRSQAVLTRAHMMQNAPPPKYLRLHQIIHRDRQAVSHDLSSHDPINANTGVTLTLPAAPDKLLQEVSKRLPAVKEVTPVSSVEMPKQSTPITMTTPQIPLLMKNYDEKADQYLVKPSKTAVLPISMHAPAPLKSLHQKILSPIERPHMVVSTVHTPSGQRTNMQQSLASPARLMPGAAPRLSVTTPLPIPSITPVRPTKPHAATPTTVVRTAATPTSAARTPPRVMPTKPSNTSFKGTPIVSSPIVNIITPASIMAQIAANKPFPVAISNPAVPTSVTHLASVAISNLSSLVSNSNPVASVVSVSAYKNVTANITAAPVGVTPIVKIRPSMGRLPPILRRRPSQPAPRADQPIQKPATPPPMMIRASSPVPPLRPPPLRKAPPPLRKAPNVRLTATSHPQSQVQKPPDLPPPPVLPRMPMLQRGALRSSIPTTSTK